MRFLVGLRLVLVAVALIGLMGGRGIVLPVTAAQATMVMATPDSGHDCCGKASRAPVDKAGLAGACLGPGCAMAAPGLLPAAPVLIVFAERAARSPAAVLGLEGRAPTPPLEPPRA